MDQPDMKRILALVQEGRLSEATGAIQSSLGGGAPASGPAPKPARPAPSAKAAPRARFAPRVRAKTSRPGAAAPLPEGARFEEQRALTAGGLSYMLYVPASAQPGAPLVVMLHGCTQGPEDFARGTRMNEAAEARGVIVAYPRQEASANPNRCWNWFEPRHQGRGGEAGAIAAIVADVVSREGADPARVFVAGLSAGGAMAANLGAAFPEVFAGVGIHSGLAAGAARDMTSAFAAMRSGGAAEPLPVRAIVFQGEADHTVAPVNAQRIARAGRGPSGPRPRQRKVEAGGRAARVTRLPATEKAAEMEVWEVAGLGHAWSGGSASGTYADPAGPDASAEMLRFFLGAPKT